MYCPTLRCHHPFHKAGDLLTEKQVVFGKIELASFVTSMGQLVVCPAQAKLQRKRIADPMPSSRFSMKATLRDVRIKRE